jgi:hypothetical protein
MEAYAANAILGRVVSEFSQLQQTVEEQWRLPFLCAVQRLGYWSSCIAHNRRPDLPPNMLDGEDFSQYWSRFLPATELLLSAATPTFGNEAQPETVKFLFELNNELLLDLAHPLYHRSNDNEIIRSLYRHYETNPPVLVAALALFDVHLDRFTDVIFDEVAKKRSRPLELLKNVFLVVVEGLNIWALRRRWLSIYFENQNRNELQIFSTEYCDHRHERQLCAAELLDELKEQLGSLGIRGELYDRSAVSLFRSSLPRADILRAIFLKITCPDNAACYLAEGWVESHGRILARLVRKSLFFPEENGARRLQVGVRSSKHNRLIVARIGTLNSHKNNEWGRLLKPIVREEVPQDKTDGELGEQALLLGENKITVYKTTGETVVLDSGSTIGDYVVHQHTLEDARHVIEVYLDATPAKMFDKLQNRSVVRVVVDKQLQRMLPLDDWHKGKHQSETTRRAIKHFEHQFRTTATQGRARLLHMLQNHVDKWGFSLNRDVLVTLMNAAGYSVNKGNEEQVFGMLLTDTSGDEHLCQLALQYCLHEMLRTQSGNRPNFNWREVRLAADCCHNVSNGEAIVGTVDEGPQDPGDPRFGRGKSLRVHRKGCDRGPSRNRLELTWAPDATSESLEWGLSVSILLSEDFEGSLLGFLNLVQSELRLDVKYVNADAVNYGRKAHIASLLLAATRRDRELAVTRIIETYRQQAQIQRLGPRDSRELLMPYGCPYIINTDPESNKLTPLLVVGRQEQLNRLRSSLHNPNKHAEMIIGYFRTGKTWLVKHFMTTHRLPDRIPIYISFDVMPKGFSPDNMVRYIYREALKALDPYYSIEHGVGAISIRPRRWYELANWFRKISQVTGYKFILFFDEFSGIGDWISRGLVTRDFPQMFVRFMDDTAEFIHFVLVFQSIHFHDIANTGSDLIKWFRSRIEDPIEVWPFTDAELGDLLTKPVEEYYKVAPDALRLAMTLTGGIPYIAALLGKTIWRYALEKKCTYISVDILQQIVKERILEDRDWEAAFYRLAQEKLPEVHLHTLTVLSTLQMAGGAAQPWEITNAVKEGEITLEVEPHRLSQPFSEVMKSLNNTRLIDKFEIDDETHWKIKCQLLADHLIRSQPKERVK